MPKQLKHPGLQPKFEQALMQILASGDALSGGALIDAIEQRRTELGVTEDELRDLRNNMANYLARAKQAGVLVGHGRYQGYSLAGVQAAPARDEALAESPSNVEAHGAVASPPPLTSPTPPEGPRTQQWESFFHLVASICLARRFSARISSLQKTSDRGTKWGNPDMLMVRANALQNIEATLRDAGIDVERFAMVDDSPRAILSSVELKVGLGSNRSLWFQAVAETAANSLWANEAWLVYIEPEGREQAPDREVLALARSAEVGILEVVLRHTDEGGASFELTEHRPAPLRSRLRVGDFDAETRVGLLTAAHDLLVAFDQEGTFLDADGDAHKAQVLLEQALENLAAQVGFGRERSLAEATQTMRLARPAWYRALIRATIAEVGELVTVPSGRGVWGDIDGAICERVAYGQARWLQAAIEALRGEAG